MKSIMNYENRKLLYESVIGKLPLKKIEEYYNEKAFGNFEITFIADNLLIRYSNDRGDLYLEIASRYIPSTWYHLSTYKNFINRKELIKSDGYTSDLNGINRDNEFLIKEYGLLNDLLDKNNHTFTLQSIDKMLAEEFKRKYPGAIEE